IQVWMGIGVGGWPVSRPAGVTDPKMPGNRLMCQQARQAHINPALLFPDLQPGPIQHGYARAVVTAVLQSSQSFQQDRHGRLPADVSNNSAHKIKSLILAAGCGAMLLRAPGNTAPPVVRKFFLPVFSLSLISAAPVTRRLSRRSPIHSIGGGPLLVLMPTTS